MTASAPSEARVAARRSPEPRSPRPHTTAATVALATVVVWIALDDGSYALTSRTALAIVVWWAIGGAVLAGLRLGRPRGPAWAVGLLLLGFAGWSAVSLAWASDRETAFDELTRALLYVGVFAAATALSSILGRRTAADGLALAVAAVAVLAGASRLLPWLVPTPDAYGLLDGGGHRLAYPIGYWNGLGVVLALGLPLLLRVAVQGGSRMLRAAAVGALPVFAVDIYLTSSRGAVVTALVAIGAYAALGAARRRLLLAAACGGALSAVAIVFVRSRPSIATEASPDVDSLEGAVAAVVLVAAAALAAFAFDVADRRFPRRIRVRTGVLRAAWVAALVAIVAVAFASDPAGRFEAFKQPPSADVFVGRDPVGAHLRSGSGNGRWQYWGVAVDEFRDHALAGGGAGSFETYWQRHRPVPLVARDAHSFYLETLGELGIVGLALGGGALAVGAVAAVAAARRARGDREAAAALAAAFLAYAVAVGLDWMWELPAVTIVGLMALAFAVAPPQTGRRRAAPAWARVVPVAALAAVAIAAQGSSLLAATRLGESRAATRRGDGPAALEAARRAAAIQPWAASPRLQLALVHERLGRLDVARRDIAAAIERDPEDWTLWVVRSRLEIKAGVILEARRSLAESRRLNPLAWYPQG